MIVHLIPFFLANVLGVRTVTVGLIEGVAESTASLVTVGSGHWSDRLGRRKWLTVAGYGLSTLAKPFLALAGSWPIVLSVRFVERMGKGIRTAPRDALIADSIREEQRGMAFGLHRAGDTAGAAVGLLTALLLVWLLQGGRLTLAPTTFQTLVWISVIPAALAVLLLALAVREQPATHSTVRPAFAWQFLPAPFKRFLPVVILFTLGNSSDAFLILRAQTAGLSVVSVLAILVVFNLVYATVSTPAGSLSDRIGRRRVLFAGWLLYALVYGGFALANAGWQIALLFVVYGIYKGMTEGVGKAFVADLVPQSQRGTAYGWFNAAVGFTILPASLLAGLLWQGIGSWAGWGVRAPFFFGAMLALMAAVVFRTWFSESVKQAL
jgi:MFS family permease